MKKSDKKDFQKVICRQLKVANNLIDVAFRNILYFLLVIDGKQVDTRVGRFNDHIERDDPETAALAATLALDTKTDLPLAATKRIANVGILHQIMLQVVNIVSQRTVAFCQSLCLTQKLFCIVEGYHCLLNFGFQLFDQCVKRCEISAGKSPFLSLRLSHE